ncbi:hypothetical protein VP1G_06455 [Cytospora mali]|uniref:Uncharacterized protein n=1 Tax=Cytospora mali TaxID=578113 RepID=A0A194V5P2_CYTMA|nr:hypothetical protein VP1G_06455 [Valsa mali var. pyri (nom. inval.)]
MAPNNISIDEDLTVKEVKVLIAALKSIDIKDLPLPDYRIMSKAYGWKWPSNSAKSDLSRLKGKLKTINARLKAAYPEEPEKEYKVTKKSSKKSKVTDYEDSEMDEVGEASKPTKATNSTKAVKTA